MSDAADDDPPAPRNRGMDPGEVPVISGVAIPNFFLAVVTASSFRVPGLAADAFFFVGLFAFGFLDDEVRNHDSRYGLVRTPVLGVALVTVAFLATTTRVPFDGLFVALTGLSSVGLIELTAPEVVDVVLVRLAVFLAFVRLYPLTAPDVLERGLQPAAIESATSGRYLRWVKGIWTTDDEDADAASAADG